MNIRIGTLIDRIVATSCLSMTLVSASFAQSETTDDPLTLAAKAARDLEHAATSLAAAEEGRDRVAALTEVVQAYETGLSSLRAGLRAVELRERVLRLDLDAREEDVARLLGVLAGMDAAPGPLLLLHPAGPLGTVHSGMMVSAVTPGLQAEARQLRSELEELSKLSQARLDGLAQLKSAHEGASTARLALSTAIDTRSPLPPRFDIDNARMQDLAAAAATLDAFAAELGSVGTEPLDATLFEAVQGQLPLPVDGTLLRGFGEADAAGIRRDGLLLATPSAALVTSPSAATLRYVGPLLDYGNVIVLEPAPDTLLVFAGLGRVYGRPGEVVAAGTALGLMPGGTGPNAEFPAEGLASAGARRDQTLYMELRRGEAPVDPADWFALTRAE